MARSRLPVKPIMGSNDLKKIKGTFNFLKKIKGTFNFLEIIF